MAYFKEKDPALVKEFMMKNPFAILCGCDAGQLPVATHVPLLMEEKGDQLFLRGHIMRQTDHHRAFQQNPNVLAIYNGPHSYVSASWYTEPRQASTWNYMTVHARGDLQFLDEDGLRDILEKLTSRFEANPQSPSLFEALNEEYISRLVKAIIAFEIKVQSIDNVFKLSQNRDENSYQHIISRLQEGDDASRQLASEMSARRSGLFSFSGSRERP